MSIIPGREHWHDGMLVYHRADGALTIHGRRHSRISPGKDRRIHADDRPVKAGYPHAGDGRPEHMGKNRPLKMRMKKKTGKKGKKGRKGRGKR